jgi:predicted DsbA family dithiol-disulfide isomerase
VTPVEPLPVPVHYDFASSICYVAHRVMARIAPALDELGIELRWTPLDLTTLCRFRRGEPVPRERRAHAASVADELGVALSVPAVWIDSRCAAAAAIASEGSGRDATWRERVFTRVFEEGRGDLAPEDVARMLGELGLELSDPDLAGHAELEIRTRHAAEQQVTGAPTFMLGSWPMGGIQTDETMRRLLERYAERAREGRVT